MHKHSICTDKLEFLREVRGFTQQVFANEIGISQDKYSKIVNGSIKMVEDDLITKMAEKLGVSEADIKTHTPVYMSFHNNKDSNNNAFPFGVQHHYNVSKEIIHQLTEQLNSKDKQIEKLLIQNNLLLEQLIQKFK